MTDLPQIPSAHTGELIGQHWPEHSEVNTMGAGLDLYRRAAESTGTADVAGTMEALIEANATGQTPSRLIEHLTGDQRKAFDRQLHQLNAAQGASVMAQDILNTKIQLNGTVMSFETAADQLLAEAAASPQTPQTQAELRKRYQELLDKAKQQAETIGKNHRATQEALVANVQKGATPEIPSTMAPTDPSSPGVPGMPDGALGGVLQNVMGLMTKPGNLPMPQLGQMGQSLAPMLQSIPQQIGQLMSSLGGAAGAGGPEDALSVLAKADNTGEQDSTLSGPAAGGAGAGLGGAGSGGAAAGANRPHGSDTSAGGKDDKAAADGKETRTTLAAEAPDNAKATLASQPGGNAVAAPSLTSAATAPAGPAVTAAPPPSIPTTTLSSGESVTGPETVSSARTHTSGGGGAVGSAALADAGTHAVGAPVAGGMGAAPMMPMMPPMMGGAPASAPTTPSSTGGGTGGDKEKALSTFTPERHETPPELTDFGSDLRGLEHATDLEIVAASVLAGLVRTHDRAGIDTEIAVGVSPTMAVFVTSAGLGFLPRGVRAPGHLTPLITVVPDDFINRWLGCSQPWRPLLEAAALDLVGPFETVVTTDAGASTFGVLTLTPEQVYAINIAAGSKDRWHFDAIDAKDVAPAADHLDSVWGRPLESPSELLAIAGRAQWNGDAGPGKYPQRWVRYLLASAGADIAEGRIDDARYALRCALRVPEPIHDELRVSP